VSIEVPRLRRTDYFVGYTAETADELFKYPAANRTLRWSKDSEKVFKRRLPEKGN